MGLPLRAVQPAADDAFAKHPDSCGCAECDWGRKHPQIPSTYARSGVNPRNSTVKGVMARGRERLAADLARPTAPQSEIRPEIGIDRGPYEVRGHRGVEVWYFDKLVATYTTQGAAEHLCKLLNGAFALGHAQGAHAAEQMVKRWAAETGPIVLSITPEQAKEIQETWGQMRPSRERITTFGDPLVVLGPGGDFTTNIGVNGESAAGDGSMPPPGTGNKTSDANCAGSSRAAEAAHAREPERVPIRRPGSAPVHREPKPTPAPPPKRLDVMG